MTQTFSFLTQLTELLRDFRKKSSFFDESDILFGCGKLTDTSITFLFSEKIIRIIEFAIEESKGKQDKLFQGYFSRITMDPSNLVVVNVSSKEEAAECIYILLASFVGCKYQERIGLVNSIYMGIPKIERLLL